MSIKAFLNRGRTSSGRSQSGLDRSKESSRSGSDYQALTKHQTLQVIPGERTAELEGLPGQPEGHSRTVDHTNSHRGQVKGAGNGEQQRDQGGDRRKPSGGSEVREKASHNQVSLNSHNGRSKGTGQESGGPKGSQKHLGGLTPSDKRFDKFKMPNNKYLDKMFENTDEDPDKRAGRELDLFMIETKSKQKITDLIDPIVAQIESEREERARIEVQQDKVVQRLEALEGILGAPASMAQPKFAEVLESKLADLKALQLRSSQELSSKMEKQSVQVASIQEDQLGIHTNLTHLQRAIDMREKQTVELQEQTVQVRSDLIETRQDFMAKLEELGRQLRADTSRMNNRVNETTKNMLEFGVRVEQMDAALEDMKQTVDRNSRRGLEVQERKLDKTEFEAHLQELHDSLETNRLATHDNFAQLLATDNYLEKYLPFRIQGMISESVTSALDQEQTKNYKKFEYATFKALHRVVLEDEGVPKLKKRGFLMPGYRKIMETGERDVYEKAAQKQLDAKREQLDTQSHDCGSHRNPALNQKTSSPAHVISGSPTLNKQSITDSLHQDIVPMEQETESDCLSSIQEENLRATSRQVQARQEVKVSALKVDQNAHQHIPKADKSIDEGKGHAPGTDAQRQLASKQPSKHSSARKLQHSKTQCSRSKHSVQSPAKINLQGLEVNATLGSSPITARKAPCSPGARELLKVDTQNLSMANYDPVPLRSGATGARAYQVGFGDIENDVVDHIRTAYNNAFALTEKFEMIRCDFRHFKREIAEQIDDRTNKIRIEAKEVLEQQMAFIQQNQERNRQQLGRNEQQLQAFAVQLAEHSTGHKQLLSLSPISSRRRSREKANKRSPASRSSVQTDKENEGGQFGIKAVNQLTSKYRTQDSFTAEKNQQSLNELHLGDNEDMAAPKGMTEWLLESHKLQNVLNNQLYGMYLTLMSHSIGPAKSFSMEASGQQTFGQNHRAGEEGAADPFESGEFVRMKETQQPDDRAATVNPLIAETDEKRPLGLQTQASASQTFPKVPSYQPPLDCLHIIQLIDKIILQCQAVAPVRVNELAALLKKSSNGHFSQQKTTGLSQGLQTSRDSALMHRLKKSQNVNSARVLQRNILGAQSNRMQNPGLMLTSRPAHDGGNNASTGNLNLESITSGTGLGVQQTDQNGGRTGTVTAADRNNTLRASAAALTTRGLKLGSEAQRFAQISHKNLSSGRNQMFIQGDAREPSAHAGSLQAHNQVHSLPRVFGLAGGNLSRRLMSAKETGQRSVITEKMNPSSSSKTNC